MAAPHRSFTLLLVLAASCASASKGTTSAEAPAPARVAVKQNPNLISHEELLDPVVYGMDVLRAIRLTRPSFFRDTGQSFTSPAGGVVQVSQDYGPLQPVSQLASYTTMMVYEIRYLSINEATNRFGLNANGGPVIVLISNKQP